MKDHVFSISFVSLPGPISSVLVNTYGCRPVMIMGGVLSSIGLISASFCNSVVELYVCIGLIGGNSDQIHFNSFRVHLIIVSNSLSGWLKKTDLEFSILCFTKVIVKDYRYITRVQLSLICQII